MSKIVDVDYLYKKDAKYYNSMYIYMGFLLFLLFIFIFMIYQK
jgi:hypothetical protein